MELVVISTLYNHCMLVLRVLIMYELLGMCVGHERIEWKYRMFHDKVGIWPFGSWIIIFYGIL